MKRISVFALSLFLGCMIIHAQSVSVEKAQQKANSLRAVSQNRVKGKKPVEITRLAYTSTDDNNPLFYVFNYADGGFAIIGGDECAREILGYSNTGAFHIDSIPEGMKDMLDLYGKQISYAISNEAAFGSSYAKVRKAPSLKSSIAPMLTTKWGQGDVIKNAYNCQIPDITKTSQALLTGCVATATAQIMKFYEFPIHGQGAPKSYTQTWYLGDGSSKTVTFSADFANTTYDWGNMKDEYPSSYGGTQSENAVGILLYHVGVAVNMLFGQDASSASSESVVSALQNYFGYNDKASMKYRMSYSDDAWEELIYNELNDGHPILYSGQSLYDGGHAFVCDGYDSTNDTYHINWGWAGYCDGYFPLTGSDVLHPAPDQITSGFNDSQSAIIGLYPVVKGIAVTNISLCESSITIEKGKTATLTATISPSDATNKEVVWSSSNEDVATVSASGVVTAIAKGKAVITAKATDGSNVTASCQVVVTSSDGEDSFEFTQKVLPTLIKLSVKEYSLSSSDGGWQVTVAFGVNNTSDKTIKANKVVLRRKYTNSILGTWTATDSAAPSVNLYYHLPCWLSTFPSSINMGAESENFAVDLYYTVDGKDYITSSDKTLVYKQGDSNLDDIVNVEDLTALIKSLNGGKTSDFYSPAVDLNEDGKISKEDLERLVKIILK